MTRYDNRSTHQEHRHKSHFAFPSKLSCVEVLAHSYRERSTCTVTVNMDMDVDHIWDLPINNPATTTHPAPSNTSNVPLFLPSDEADAAADINALFDGIDDLNESAPALDLDALRREADARNTRLVRAEISATIPTIQLSTTTVTKGGEGRKGPLDGINGGDENEDGKKKRKPIPKLDEARLLGKSGFPQLITDTTNFKPKGKGHEVTYSSLHSSPPLRPIQLTSSRRFRQPIWTACSRCINSGPIDSIQTR